VCHYPPPASGPLPVRAARGGRGEGQGHHVDLDAGPRRVCPRRGL